MARKNNSEAGITIPLFALLLSVIFIIAALVLDNSKEEVAAENIQRTADAAALAAARQLNGRVDGWWDSKKAAVVALRENPILGADSAKQAKLVLNEKKPGKKGEAASYWDRKGASDPLTKGTYSEDERPPEANSGLAGQAGGLTVQVERGLYLFNPVKKINEFKSLEEEYDSDGLKGAVPSFIIANAVRVTVTLDKLNTVFGKLFGVSFFEKLSRESVALMDHTLDRPVAPIGIPLCQLLLNTDPNPSGSDRSHLKGKYDSGEQCPRAAFAAELGVRGDVPIDLSGKMLNIAEERGDGLVRAEFFERGPYYSGYETGNLCQYKAGAGARRNCKALPISATLGVPADSLDNATAAETVAAISAMGSNAGPHARIGSFFRPLPSSEMQNFTDEDSRKIAKAINDSGVPFRDVFLDENLRPRPNFPFLRTVRPGGGNNENLDRLYRAPVADSDEPIFLLQDMSYKYDQGLLEDPLHYSNPMCHFDDIPHNSPNQAKVISAYAMVLIPSVEALDNGTLVQYCDYERVFLPSTNPITGNKPQRAVAPIKASAPQVVGFVPIEIFDFNFQDLSQRPFKAGLVNYKDLEANDPLNNDVTVAQTDHTPVYTGNGVGPLWDGSPYGISLTGTTFGENFDASADRFDTKFQEYQQCLKDEKAKQDGNSSDQGACDGKANQADNEGNGIKNLFRQTEWRDCLDFGQFDALFEGLSDGLGVHQALGKLRDILEKPIPAKPNTHCLPRLENGRSNLLLSSSYTELHDLKAGRGCGGLRIRLGCDSKNSVIPTGQSHDLDSPTLVSTSAD